MAKLCFFSRRAYNRSTHRFSDGLAELTRFVGIDQIGGTISSGAIMARDDWAAEVRRQAGSDGVLCYVHGFNTPQIDMLRRVVKIRDGLAVAGWRGAVIAYDWPHKPGAVNYPSARGLAKKSAPYLVGEGLAPLLGDKLHVIAHSMGAMVTVRGFAQTRDLSPVPWGVQQVALVSADLDAEEMAKGTGHADVMDKRCRRMTNYYSNRDRVLKLSEDVVSGGRERLGFKGIPTENGAGFVDVACGTRYHQTIPKPSKASQEQLFSHNWYFEDAFFYRDLAATLAGVAAGNMGQTRGISGGGPDQALKP